MKDEEAFVRKVRGSSAITLTSKELLEAVIQLSHNLLLLLD
jgi:hypothetical protein